MTTESQPPAEAVPAFAAPSARGEAIWWIVAAALLAVLHLVWLLGHFAPAIMSPDANGYVVQARLIANEGQTSFATASPVQFVGMHWLETKEGVFHSRYPAGWPMLMALAWKFGGLTAALLLNPLLASATVLLVFLLARPLAGDVCALLAAAVVATNPIANQHALDADSHTAATFFLVAGVLALRRFMNGIEAARVASSLKSDTPAPGRLTAAIGFLGGGLLGVIPTIRYPEAIVGVTVAAWLAWRVRPLWRAWPAVAGAAIPIGALCAHNAIAYGAFWRTGYALTHEQTGFGLSYFVSHAIPYLQSLLVQGPALFFAFGAAGLAAMAADRRWRGDGVLFVGIVVPLVLLYMAYYFGGGPGGAGGGGNAAAAMTGNMRFLIPTFPFFAVAGAWLLNALVRNFGTAGRVALGVVAALQLLVTVSLSQQALARSKTSLTAAAQARRVAQSRIPVGSVVILDHSMGESLDAVGLWRIVEENVVGGMGGRGGPGLGMGMGRGPRGGMGPGGGAPDGAGDRPSPQQVGKNRAQRERYEGLSVAERRQQVWSDIAAWAADRPVYWLARSLDAVDAALPNGADYENIAEIDAPSMGMGPMGGGMGPGGPGGPGGLAGRGARGAGMRGGRFDPAMGGGPRGGMGFGPPGVGGMADDAAGGSTKLRLVKITFAKT